MSWDYLEDAKAKASKILGDKADMPKEKVDFDKLATANREANKAFVATRDDLAAKLLASETSVNDVISGIKQTAAIFEKSDFGLDPNDKEDGKKIKQAQQVFSTAMSEAAAEYAGRIKMMDELDKHIIQLGKYKAPKD